MKNDETTNETAAKTEEKAESGQIYTHVFKKPYEYNGNCYDMLTFDFGKLTGKDSLAIELELQSRGIAVTVPWLVGPYLARVVARACTVPLGIDGIEKMPLRDWTAIRSKASNFLMGAEL